MRNVLIIGAGDWIGKATAKLLKNEKLLLVDRYEKNLKKTAQNLNADILFVI